MQSKCQQLIYSFIFLLICSMMGCGTYEAESAESNQVVPQTPYVVILGVAQDAGYPQAGCHKACCEGLNIHDARKRFATSLGLVTPKSQKRYLFEATPDFREQLTMLDNVALSATSPGLDGIFLTHAHIGHYAGLIHLGREVMGTKGVPVFAMPRMQAFLTENGPWSQLVGLGNIKLEGLLDKEEIQLGDEVQVTPIVVPHRDEFSETVGFLIEGPSKKLLFIPDINKWEKWEQSISEWIQKVDYALLDGTFFKNGEIPGRDMSEIPHPFIVETMDLLSDLPAEEKQKVLFIHFNHTNPVLNGESEAAQLVIKNGFGIAQQGSSIAL